MRVLAAVVLVVAAGVCLVKAWDSLNPLFPGGYVDSPVFVYVMFGSAWVWLATTALFLALTLVRPVVGRGRFM